MNEEKLIQINGQDILVKAVKQFDNKYMGSARFPNTDVYGLHRDKDQDVAIEKSIDKLLIHAPKEVQELI